MFPGGAVDPDDARVPILGRSHAEADALVKNAEQKIQLETTRALAQIRQEAVDLSVTIASKLLQRNITKEDNEKLITEALAPKGNWVDAAKRLYETGTRAFPARRRRSIAKAVSWRVIGSLSTFALAWLITDNLTLAASIVAAEIAAKTAFYYLHERAWSLVSWSWPAR